MLVSVLLFLEGSMVLWSIVSILLYSLLSNLCEAHTYTQNMYKDREEAIYKVENYILCINRYKDKSNRHINSQTEGI